VTYLSISSTGRFKWTFGAIWWFRCTHCGSKFHQCLVKVSWSLCVHYVIG